MRVLKSELLANQDMVGWQRLRLCPQSTRQDCIEIAGLALSDGAEMSEAVDDWANQHRQKVLLRFSFW